MILSCLMPIKRSLSCYYIRSGRAMVARPDKNNFIIKVFSRAKAFEYKKLRELSLPEFGLTNCL